MCDEVLSAELPHQDLACPLDPLPPAFLLSLLDLAFARDSDDDTYLFRQAEIISALSFFLRAPGAIPEALARGLIVDRLLTASTLSSDPTLPRSHHALTASIIECLATLVTATHTLHPTKTRAQPILSALSQQIHDDVLRSSSQPLLHARLMSAAVGLLRADHGGLGALIARRDLALALDVLTDAFEQATFSTPSARVAAAEGYESDRRLLPALHLLRECAAQGPAGPSFLTQALFAEPRGGLWSRFAAYAGSLVACGPENVSEAVARDPSVAWGHLVGGAVVDVARALENRHFRSGDLPPHVINGLVELAMARWIPAYFRSPHGLVGREAFGFAARLAMAAASEFRETSLAAAELTDGTSRAMPLRESQDVVALLSAPRALILLAAESICGKVHRPGPTERLSNLARSMSPTTEPIDPTELEIDLFAALCSLEADYATLFNLLLTGRSDLLVHLAPALLSPTFEDSCSALLFGRLLRSALDCAEDRADTALVRSVHTAIKSCALELVELDGALGCLLAPRLASPGLRALTDAFGDARAHLPSALIERLRAHLHLLSADPCPERATLTQDFVRAASTADGHEAVGQTLRAIAIRSRRRSSNSSGAPRGIRYDALADHGAPEAAVLADLRLVTARGGSYSGSHPSSASGAAAHAKKKPLGILQAKFRRAADSVSAVLSPKGSTAAAGGFGRLSSKTPRSHATDVQLDQSLYGRASTPPTSQSPNLSLPPSPVPFAPRFNHILSSPASTRNITPSPNLYQHKADKGFGGLASCFSGSSASTASFNHSVSPTFSPGRSSFIDPMTTDFDEDIEQLTLVLPEGGGPGVRHATGTRTCFVCHGRPPIGYGFKLCGSCRESNASVVVRLCGPACLAAHEAADHSAASGTSGAPRTLPTITSRAGSKSPKQPVKSAAGPGPVAPMAKAGSVGRDRGFDFPLPPSPFGRALSSLKGIGGGRQVKKSAETSESAAGSGDAEI